MGSAGHLNQEHTKEAQLRSCLLSLGGWGTLGFTQAPPQD